MWRLSYYSLRNIVNSSLRVCVVFLCAIFLMPAALLAQPITFTGITDTAFGQIDYTGAATGTIDMGTDGTIIYGAGFTGSGIGTAGGFTINGAKNADVDISCATTATMANSAGATLPITSVEFVMDRGGNAGAFGTGNACLGLGTTVITHRLKNNTAQNAVAVGMRIDATGGVPSGPGFFSTANPGGASLTFRVVYP